MTIKRLHDLLKVLKDGIQSIYLYQKGKDKIPVLILDKVDFVSLNGLRHFFAHERFIILTQGDIEQGGDVFCLQLLHIKNHAELFYGKDILGGFHFKKSDLRSLLELELRNKRVQLREQYLSQNSGRDFLRHILPSMQIIREGALALKSPEIHLPNDIKEVVALFDVAWSCNSQIFYYLIDDRVEERKIPQLINDLHTYLSEVCDKINDFTL